MPPDCTPRTAAVPDDSIMFLHDRVPMPGVVLTHQSKLEGVPNFDLLQANVGTMHDWQADGNTRISQWLHCGQEGGLANHAGVG